jgi:hypothetical protein
MGILKYVPIVLLVAGCATLPAKDPTFSLKKVTIIERSDGTTLQVHREFERVTEAEYEMLSEAEKILWKIIKKQVGL